MTLVCGLSELSLCNFNDTFVKIFKVEIPKTQQPTVFLDKLVLSPFALFLSYFQHYITCHRDL